MNKQDADKVRKQYQLYRSEIRAKRHNLHAAARSEGNAITRATALHEATMMLIRTEAKARAMCELADVLGIDLEG